MSDIRTRFAPSPTGYLHVGGARTALFCWLFARRNGGVFVLRIEDTDRERSTDESIKAILDSMQWLGLNEDEGPFYQTKRFDRYAEIADQLLAEGHAYPCYCTREELTEMREAQLARKEKPRYDGRCRDRDTPRDGVDPVLRFKTPLDGEVVVNDLVRGQVIFQNAELDDLIIARSDGTPTYNFTVVIDDIDMRITHVVRGDDHLNNTPRQINIFKALGAELPVFAHLPMILGADGSRLSKRHGSVSVLEYRDQGYLPEALLNYLVRLGWAHGDQEIFSMDEMISLFDLAEVNKSASTFNPEKLQWLNQQHIISSSFEAIETELKWQYDKLGLDTNGGPPLPGVFDALRERAPTLEEMAMGSEFFFREFDSYHEKAARKHLAPASLTPLTEVRQSLAGLEDWKKEGIHDVLTATTERLDIKFGKVAQPVRVAVSGGPVSPPIDMTLELLGRRLTLSRLDRAIAFVQAREEQAPAD